MRYVVLLSLICLFFTPASGQRRAALGANGFRWVVVIPPGPGFLDSAQFSFATSLTKAGYTTVAGEPTTGIRSATGSYGIGVTSITTARWAPVGGGSIAGGSDNGGTAGTFIGYWYRQTNFTNTIADTNLRFTGLVPLAQYNLEFFASRTTGGVDRFCSYIVRDANGDTTAAGYNVKDNVSTWQSLGIRTADVNGNLIVVVAPQIPYNAASPYAYIGLARLRRWPRAN